MKKMSGRREEKQRGSHIFPILACSFIGVRKCRRDLVRADDGIKYQLVKNEWIKDTAITQVLFVRVIGDV